MTIDGAGVLALGSRAVLYLQIASSRPAPTGDYSGVICYPADVDVALMRGEVAAVAQLVAVIDILSAHCGTHGDVPADSVDLHQECCHFSNEIQIQGTPARHFSIIRRFAVGPGCALKRVLHESALRCSGRLLNVCRLSGDPEFPPLSAGFL